MLLLRRASRARTRARMVVRLERLAITRTWSARVRPAASDLGRPNGATLLQPPFDNGIVCGLKLNRAGRTGWRRGRRVATASSEATAVLPSAC